MGIFSRTLTRLDELKRVLTRDPGSRQFLALADEYRRQGLIKEAIDVLERGLVQNPTAIAGHVALGRLLQQNGRLDEALSSYQAALKLDPQNLVALRQTADLHLSRGDKVEAIKKLKLFRGLSPGEKDVNDLIRQLDDELTAASSGRTRAPEEVGPPPLPAPEFRTGSVPRSKPSPSASAPHAVVSPVAPPELPSVPMVRSSEGLQGSVQPVLPGADVPSGGAPLDEEAGPFAEVTPSMAGAPFVPESQPALPVPGPFEMPDLPETSPLEEAFGDLEPAPTVGGKEGAVLEPEHEPALAAPPLASPMAAAPARETPAVPSATETLAELLRSQGHLAAAGEAYRELALSEPDEGRAERFRRIAQEISTSRFGTVRGRLEAWGEAFSRGRSVREPDLVSTVEEVVERLGASAAVVTDFEGVPVVTAGPLTEADAMENLAAELTAFWKNVRRSQAEIGEGALDGLVLSGSAGTAAVKLITPAYALLVKAGPGIPCGRIRFEVARAAEQLRPALL